MMRHYTKKKSIIFKLSTTKLKYTSTKKNFLVGKHHTTPHDFIIID